ncbi:glycosyl transferase family group 2-domain-containing protein [Cladochytrium replicatum]|nr:glycosyl transferase family group 2-domain-containing protein [Cladochytrium replicatum]
MADFNTYIQSIPWRSLFQRLPGLWLLCLIPLTIWGPIYTPAIYAVYYTILHVLFLVNNMRSGYGMYISYNSAKVYSTTDWLKKYCDETGTVDGLDARHDLPFDHVVHVIILPNYKEDFETLCETLDILASHTRAVTQYKVCLAMEGSEAGAEQKAQTLLSQYTDSFYDITYTIHPAGMPGEIRGKSSNVAWAAAETARRSGGGLHGRHEHEIITVMDADTAFAEDYFMAITYHYCISSPSQRRIMMFAPSTVFDRNSKDVPVFVRVTDMFWSIGVMSNLYASSPVKMPCSAYSVSMDLAIAVGFWDSGPDATGEDLHMYLKCFFMTDGEVIVKPIFSPASCCNVQGEGEGMSGWISDFKARYTQAKRHLWGSLDTGFALRRTLLEFLAPGSQPTIKVSKSSYDNDKQKSATEQKRFALKLSVLTSLIHRLFEAHIVMGHLFMLIITSTLLLPVRSALSYSLAAYLYSFISSDPVHPYVELALNVCYWVRLAIVIPNIFMIWYYEKYHKWVGFERWWLQEAQQSRQTTLYGSSKPMLKGASDDLVADQQIALRAAQLGVSSSHAHMRVQHLGMRASHQSQREYPRNLFDWLTIPIAGFFFYVAPQFHAQLTQLFTDQLDYKVAGKPKVIKKEEPVPGTMRAGIALTGVVVEKGPDPNSASSSKSDEGFFEEYEEEVSSGTDRVGSRMNLVAMR